MKLPITWVEDIQNLTTGTHNVCIGYETGPNGTGVTHAIGIGVSLGPSGDTIHMGRSGQYIYTGNDGDGSWSQTSDERKKQNITDVSLGLDFVNDLRTVTYQSKPAEEHPEEWGHFRYEKDEDGNEIGEKIYSEVNTETVHHGMIAQEVKAALDKVGSDGEDFQGWNEDENGKQGLSLGSFVLPLIKAVQELSAKVTALENA